MRENHLAKTGGLFIITGLVLLYVIKEIFDFELLTFFIIAAIGLVISILYMVIYNQKVSAHVCKDCGIKQTLVTRSRVSQEEIIRRGKFIFINTYDYHYHCNQCEKDTHIKKRVKMK